MCWGTNRSGGGVEFIFVNDGSSDNTYDKLLEIKTRYPDNVTVINQSNRGVAEARNAGIRYATGTWIGFLDADDYLIPGALHFLLNYISDKIDILHFECFISDKIPTALHKLQCNWCEEFKGRDFYLKYNEIVVWKYLFRKSFLVENNILFPNITIGEDTLFTFFSQMANGLVCCIDTVAVYHIYRADSLTTSIKPEHVRKVAKSIIFIQHAYNDYIYKHSLPSSIIDKINQHRLRMVMFLFKKIAFCKTFSKSEIVEIRNQLSSGRAFPIKGDGIRVAIANLFFRFPFLFYLYPQKLLS